MRLFSIALLCAAALMAQTARRAPGFSLPDSHQRQHDLADYRGKVVLIDIIRTDCPHCKTFSYILEQAKARYGAKIAVLAVVHPPDTPPLVARYIAENKLTYPVLFDCGQMAFSYILPSPLHPSITVPHLFIVAPDGMIRGNFEYGPETQEIFAGKGLYAEIDRVLGVKR